MRPYLDLLRREPDFRRALPRPAHRPRRRLVRGRPAARPAARADRHGPVGRAGAGRRHGRRSRCCRPVRRHRRRPARPAARHRRAPTPSPGSPRCCCCSSQPQARRGSRWSRIGVVAAAKAFAQPAGTAALPNLVGPEDLPTASVLSGASWGTMLAVGAALGGLVAGTLGARACFVIDAALLLLAAALVAPHLDAVHRPVDAAARAPVGAARRRRGADVRPRATRACWRC